MSFSNRIRELRLQNNLSQEQIARELDIATRTYIRYEKGKNYPSEELLAQMATLFKVDKPFLMDEQNESIHTAPMQRGKRGKLSAKQFIEEISVFFESGELSETEKDELMEAVQSAYWKAKKKNRQE